MKLSRTYKSQQTRADEWHRYIEARRKLEREWRNYTYYKDHGVLVASPDVTPPITPDGTPPPEANMLDHNVTDLQRMIGGMKTRISNLEIALSEHTSTQ